jgi:hypothetical protein
MLILSVNQDNTARQLRMNAMKLAHPLGQAVSLAISLTLVSVGMIALMLFESQALQ